MYLQTAKCEGKTTARYANVLLAGQVTGKSVPSTVEAFKKTNNLRKRVIPHIFMLLNGSGRPIQHVISLWLSAKSYLDHILAEPEQGCQRRYKRCCNDSVI